MIEQPRLLVGGLGQAFAAAAPNSKTERPAKPEQIVVRDLDRAASMFEFLITGAVCQQDRLRFLDLNQNGPDSGHALIECKRRGVHPGYPIGRDYEGLDDALMMAFTERRTPEEIERLAEALSAVGVEVAA